MQTAINTAKIRLIKDAITKTNLLHSRRDLLDFFLPHLESNSLNAPFTARTSIRLPFMSLCQMLAIIECCRYICYKAGCQGECSSAAFERVFFLMDSHYTRSRFPSDVPTTKNSQS